MNEETGLVHYDAMCQAIAIAHDVDEAKELRDKALALEVYAKQAMNMQAELRAREIRLRAERKTGQLLRKLERGQGGGNGSNQHQKSNSVRGTRSSEYAKAIDNANLSEDQARRFQRLADVDDEDFEDALADPDEMPTTAGILRRPGVKDIPPRSTDARSLWVWGRILDFESRDYDAKTCVDGMGGRLRNDVARAAPKVILFLEKLLEECRDEPYERNNGYDWDGNNSLSGRRDYISGDNRGSNDS